MARREPAPGARRDFSMATGVPGRFLHGNRVLARFADMNSAKRCFFDFPSYVTDKYP
jgi:hypothetical protein